MKNLVSLFLLWAISLSVSAQADIEKFVIPSYNSIEEYQQLVGKTITYYPKMKYISLLGRSSLSQQFNLDFKLRDFVVESISAEKKKKDWIKTLWSLKEVGTGINRKITVYIGNYTGKIDSYYRDECLLKDFQFFLYDQWKVAHQSEIGTEIKDPLVKGIYKVVDVKLDIVKNSSYDNEIAKVYTVESPFTNTKRDYIASEVRSKCFEEDKSGRYHTYLSKVEKPSNPSIKYGKTTVIKGDGKQTTKFSYIDNFIDILIFGDSEQFSFVLKNVSQTTQKLIWDDAVFVGIDGSTSKVMHSGVKYSERSASQPASTIIKGASLEDIACPISNVYYDEGTTINHKTYGNGWKTRSMYPKTISKDIKQVSLMLPIQIKDVENEYIFVFDVKYEYNHPERLNLGENDNK